MKEEFQSANQQDEGSVKHFMDSMCLGALAGQLGELKFGELLDTPPPGFDEAFAIAKVMQFVESPEYCRFSRIVFDTAPTVMALRESSRLCASLLKEKFPVRRLVVNQLLPQSASDCKFCAMNTKDQIRVLDMIPKDHELAKLALIPSHLMDVEIRESQLSNLWAIWFGDEPYFQNVTLLFRSTLGCLEILHIRSKTTHLV